MHALCGRRYERSLEAIAVLDGNDVLGVTGIYPEHGCLVLVARFSDKARTCLPQHRRIILKAGREILRRAAKWRLPVLTLADPQYEGSVGLITHFGFKQKSHDLYELENP